MCRVVSDIAVAEILLLVDRIAMCIAGFKGSGSAVKALCLLQKCVVVIPVSLSGCLLDSGHSDLRYFDQVREGVCVFSCNTLNIPYFRCNLTRNTADIVAHLLGLCRIPLLTQHPTPLLQLL